MKINRFNKKKFYTLRKLYENIKNINLTWNLTYKCKQTFNLSSNIILDFIYVDENFSNMTFKITNNTNNSVLFEGKLIEYKSDYYLEVDHNYVLSSDISKLLTNLATQTEPNISGLITNLKEREFNVIPYTRRYDYNFYNTDLVRLDNKYYLMDKENILGCLYDKNVIKPFAINDQDLDLITNNNKIEFNITVSDPNDTTSNKTNFVLFSLNMELTNEEKEVINKINVLLEDNDYKPENLAKFFSNFIYHEKLTLKTILDFSLNNVGWLYDKGTNIDCIKFNNKNYDIPHLDFSPYHYFRNWLDELVQKQNNGELTKSDLQEALNQFAKTKDQSTIHRKNILK